MPEKESQASMIGAFARKLRAHDTAAHAPDYEKLSDESTAHDAPPERFVERIAHEGGDVIFTPLLESLRAVLQRRTLPSSPENVEAPSNAENVR